MKARTHLLLDLDAEQGGARRSEEEEEEEEEEKEEKEEEKEDLVARDLDPTFSKVFSQEGRRERVKRGCPKRVQRHRIASVKDT
ncbi:hypothetical protein G5I_07372 [Acromyrmex echinatior]|uniref:Uncharacterized protein n=1 Tax=Acromyrmex echinatior TaxID=103372 RepID=F4WNL9_ACREC|nr:hypothetical protein G5I_07372 [Acromyrmex echinatior]